MGSYVGPEREFDSELGVGRMPDFPTTFAPREDVSLEESAPGCVVGTPGPR